MAYDAAYYRRQAALAQADADTTTLDNVRDRALRSVAAFETIAEGLERTARRRAAAEERAAEVIAQASAPLAQ
jgi:hypothetical protein